MKTNTKNKFIYIIVLLLALVVFFPIAHGVTYAAKSPQIDGSDFEDQNLYTRLARGVGLIRVETFNNEKYTTLTLDGVTTGDKSKNIVSINDLKKFKFDYTKVLDLSNNSISEINADVLATFPYLEELIVSNNELTRIDISGCYNLKKIYLDRNKLQSIDLTDMNPTDGYVDLSCNYLDSQNDIVYPSQTVNVNTTIDLYNNNISDFTHTPTGYTLNLGMQGLSVEDGIIEKSKKLVYYKPSTSQNIKIVVSGGQEDIVIVDSEMEKSVTEFSLDNGDYEVSYYFIDTDGEKVVSTKTAFARTGDPYYEEFFKYYEYKTFKVVPTLPTYVYIIGNKQYGQFDNPKINKKAVIKLSADEDAKLYYSVAGGDWQEGNQIEIKKGGKYTIDVKAVSLDGKYESGHVSIFIDAAANLKFPSILIVVLIIIGAVLLFAVGFPLLRKYVL